MTNPTRPARQARATCTDASARRWWRVAFVLLSACYAGCIMPIRSNPDSAPSSSPPKQTRADAPSAAADTSDGVTVERLMVNGHTIEAPELWQGLEEKLSAQSRALTPEAYAVHVQQRAAQLITDRIAETLLYQHAVLHLPPEVRDNVDKYVDAEIRKIVSADYDGIQSRYEKVLESRGQTFEEVRQELRREITIAGFLEREIRPKVAEPTRAELLAAFEALADSFRKPVRRRMSLIDLRIRRHSPAGMDGPSPDQGQTPKDEARSRARTALAELRSGADFADVARRYSDGLHAAEGGAWGWVVKGSVRERFEPAVEALYRLHAAAVSEIVETDDGFFLVRCDEVDQGFEPTFPSVQPQLKERYIVGAYNRLIAELVTDLRAKARIEPPDLDRFHAAVVQAAP